MVGVVPGVVCSLIDKGAICVLCLRFGVGQFLVDLVPDQLVGFSSKLLLFVPVKSRYCELNFFLETSLRFCAVKIWIGCRTQTSTLFLVENQISPDFLLRVSKPDSRKNRNEISFLRTLARQVRRGPSFFKDTGRLDSYHSHHGNCPRTLLSSALPLRVLQDCPIQVSSTALLTIPASPSRRVDNRSTA